MKQLKYLSLLGVMIVTLGGCDAQNKDIAQDEDTTVSEVVASVLEAEEECILIETDVDTSNWKTYRNEKYGYEIQIPPDWVDVYGFTGLPLRPEDEDRKGSGMIGPGNGNDILAISRYENTNNIQDIIDYYLGPEGDSRFTKLLVKEGFCSKVGYPVVKIEKGSSIGTMGSNFIVRSPNKLFKFRQDNKELEQITEEIVNSFTITN